MAKNTNTKQTIIIYHHAPKGLPAKAFLLGMMALLCTCFAFGQGTTAVLGGKVFDPQGRVIPGATVTVISNQTTGHWVAPTNSAGSWRIEGLVAGNYHFQVSAPGFKTLDHNSIALQIGDQKFIDVTLSVGESSQTVHVSGVTPLVDTTSAVSGTVLTTAEIQELPAESNTPFVILGLVPGITQGSGLNNTAHLWSNATFQELTANGSGEIGANAINVTIDGGTDTFGSGGVAFIPPVDAIAQVRVVTNAYDASIGRASSATISLSMKSGTRQFHGTVYEINQTNVLNANLQQNGGTHTRKPPVHFNEYGGAVGGPVWLPKLYGRRKQQTFFFFNFDGIRNAEPTGAGYMSLPTAAERQGDFSQSFTTHTVGGVTTRYPIVIYNPYTIDMTTGNRQPFPGSIVTGKFSPVAKALLALMPLPNHPNNGDSTDSDDYAYNYSKTDKFANWGLRIDKAWNNNNHSYVEFRYNNWSEYSYYFGPSSPANILLGWDQARDNYGLTVDHTWVITPTLVLNLQGNATTHKTGFSSPGVGADPTKYGFSNALAKIQLLKAIPQVSGVGFTMGTGNNSTTKDYLYEGTAKLTQSLGNHTLNYGVEYLLQQEADMNNPRGAGSFNFSDAWTTQNPNTTPGIGVGSSLASFLLGLPSSGSISNDASSFWSQPYLAFYVQDDWRATSKLTLNFGLRWAAQFALKERDNRYFSRFNPNENIAPVTNYAQPNYASLLAGSPTANTGVQLLQQYGPRAIQANGAILYAGVNGTSTAVSNPHYKYFQPRLGFAYSFYPNTVIRGGLGRFVAATFNNGDANQLGYSATTPFIATTDNYYTPASTLDDPFPSGLVPVTGNSKGILTSVGSVESYIDPSNPQPYTDEASLHLQQQVKNYLFEIGGTLNLSRRLWVAYDVNEPSLKTWLAAYGPQFDSTGRPVDTLSANEQVANPFYGAPYITSGLQNEKTIEANQLLRPHPLVGSMTDWEANGKSTYYALQSKAEKRYEHGFSLLADFTWSKMMTKDLYYTAPAISEKLKRTLDPGDQTFQITASPIYDLPFGRGQYIGGNVNRLENELIGGWRLTGVFTFVSGTPLTLPTDSNTVFYDGHDPSLGSRKSKKEWFNTADFAPFPSRNTTVAQLAAYPAWTKVSSLPGYGWVPTSATDPTRNGVYNDYYTRSNNFSETFGDIRNPYEVNIDLGVHKIFPIYKGTRLEIRADAYNALNHPQFGNINTSPGDKYFGYWSGSPHPTAINDPRTIQFEGKFYF